MKKNKITKITSNPTIIKESAGITISNMVRCAWIVENKLIIGQFELDDSNQDVTSFEVEKCDLKNKDITLNKTHYKIIKTNRQ